MKAKFKWIISLGCVSALCLAAAAACSEPTNDEQLRGQGYKISVTYDVNGGKLMGSEGITIIDYFNPDHYTANDDGAIEIKLLNPTDPKRMENEDPISVTRPGYFYTGWYKERTDDPDGDGVITDKDGNVLEKKEKKGSKGAYGYYYKDTEKEGIPVYGYSGLWNFEEDVLSYTASEYANSNGEMSMTLYAAWIPYFEYQYYCEQEVVDENGVTKIEWIKYATTSFDPQQIAANSDKQDHNTILLPDWKDGAMNHEYKFADGITSYTFPKVEDKTFVAAYTDDKCTQAITDSFTHKGTWDVATGVATGYVQKIYVETIDGVHYKINSAEELINNVNTKGIYEIQADLDFTGKIWPAAFAISEFTGKMVATAGKTFTLKNINAKIADNDVSEGGLFASVGNGAEIANLTFENVTLDLNVENAKTTYATFGLFAGTIDENAKLTNVTVGGLLKIGKLNLGNGWAINLLANGNTTGVTKTEIKALIYGVEDNGYYHFTYAPYEKVKDENGKETGEIKWLIYINPETDNIEGFEFGRKRLPVQDEKNQKEYYITYGGVQ